MGKKKKKKKKRDFLRGTHKKSGRGEGGKDSFSMMRIFPIEIEACVKFYECVKSLFFDAREKKCGKMGMGKWIWG
jgi:hypothetical protein